MYIIDFESGKSVTKSMSIDPHGAFWQDQYTDLADSYDKHQLLWINLPLGSIQWISPR